MMLQEGKQVVSSDDAECSSAPLKLKKEYRYMSNASWNFTGRVVLVTGAADGIGFAIANQFLNAGAQIVASDISGDKLQRAFVGNAANLSLIEADIAHKHTPARLIESALRSFGKLNILVNGAGIYKNAPIETSNDDEWHQVIGVNLDGVYRLCREAIPFLRAADSGRIINIASTGAFRSEAGSGAYVVSKHGVAGLTKTLAIELGGDGITANYICPGAILSGMTRDSMEDPETRALLEGMAILKRVGHPEEIAQAALFLASDEAAFITGHGLVVDGGYLTKG